MWRLMVDLLSRAPIRGREHTPPEGTTMRNKKPSSAFTMRKRVFFLRRFWAGVLFRINNILVLCGDFQNVGLAKGSLQNPMPNHCFEYLRNKLKTTKKHLQ